MDINARTSTSSTKPQSSHEETFKYWIEGMHIQFPRFKHDHPPVVDVNELADERLTVGQRVADIVAANIGSWPFIILQSILLGLWIVLNLIAWAYRWDPYPFIFLNLMLSFQAAYAAPFIMMSQNRQSQKDRLMADSDYHCNLKGEEEVRNIMEHLDHQDTVILEILQHMEAHHKEVMEHLARLDPEMARRFGVDMQQLAAEETEQQ